jgi:radical SAM-linked protein
MLVCYDCGVACDLSKMRDDRLVALRTLGADEPRVRSGPEDDVRSERVRKRGFNDAVEAPWATYRIRFTKLGRAAFLGHLDLVRLLARSFRRADVPLAVTRGFSPKPRMSFGPALGLGVPALAELLDADIEHGPDGAWTGDAIADRLRTVVPEGISILACELVPPGDRGLGRRVRAFDLLVQPSEPLDEAALAALAAEFLARTESPVARKDRTIDVRKLVEHVELVGPGVASRLCAALDWEYRPLLRARITSTADGSAKPVEVARALGLWGADDPRAPHARVARLGLVETE